MIEAISLAIITAALYYTVTKIDGLDRRLDRLTIQFEKLEANLPKRSSDRSNNGEPEPLYYSPNSGIDL
jgi:hypothetical protein